MSNPRVWAALAVVGLFGWWLYTRDATPEATPLPPDPVQEPRSAAGKVVQEAGDRAQKASDDYAKKVEERTPEE